MKNVIPTLTAGLIEVAKIRPEDPIDFLAEFMFKVSKLLIILLGKPRKFSLKKIIN